MPTPDSRQSGTNSTGATTLSWSHRVGAGLNNSILLVLAESGGAGALTISGVNWDDLGTPVAMTQKGHVVGSLNDSASDIWYLLAPAAGTKTIKVTWSASSQGVTGSASYSNVNQATPFNAASPQSATGTDNLPTLNVTSAVGELVVGMVSDPEYLSSDTLVAGSGITPIYNITNGTSTASAGGDAAGAASVTMAWTGITGGGDYAILGVSLRPATVSLPSPKFCPGGMAMQQRMR